MNALANRQHGVSLAGMLLVAVGLIFIAITAMKLVPAYMHSAQISKILREVSRDPSMQNATINEIKDSYRKRANINYITDISADDIDIDKSEGQLNLSVNYSIKIPLAGNITLLLEFNPSSS